MRFIHTADLHLGVKPDAGSAYTKGRPEEILGKSEGASCKM